MARGGGDKQRRSSKRGKEVPRGEEEAAHTALTPVSEAPGNLSSASSGDEEQGLNGGLSTCVERHFKTQQLLLQCTEEA